MWSLNRKHSVSLYSTVEMFMYIYKNYHYVTARDSFREPLLEALPVGLAHIFHGWITGIYPYEGVAKWSHICVADAKRLRQPRPLDHENVLSCLTHTNANFICLDCYYIIVTYPLLGSSDNSASSAQQGQAAAPWWQFHRHDGQAVGQEIVFNKIKFYILRPQVS